MTGVVHRLEVAATQGHMEVGYRHQESHQPVAAVWPMLWLRPLRRETKRLLIVVSCDPQKKRRGRRANKLSDDEDDNDDWD